MRDRDLVFVLPGGIPVQVSASLGYRSSPKRDLSTGKGFPRMLTRLDKYWHTSVMPYSPGERLRVLLRASHHTQTSLADAIGVHVNALRGWLRDDYTPRDPETRARLADQLGEDVYAQYVTVGDGPTAVRIEDLDDDTILNEFLRRWRSRPRQARGPIVISDEAARRVERTRHHDDDRDQGDTGNAGMQA